jgi:hypothetical protein
MNHDTGRYMSNAKGGGRYFIAMLETLVRSDLPPDDKHTEV